MNTDKLEGSDMERLADCIKYARREGLSIGKYTQCGLNDSSGNVWLWDEDWPGCIYQNIGFDGPFIAWSCPNCGHEEDDLSTMQEAHELDDRYNRIEGCSECKADEMKEVE